MDVQPLNTRRCGLCRGLGHDRRRCDLNENKPQPRNIARWSHARRPQLADKYKCACGKQEMNKGNLRRHMRGPNCPLMTREQPAPTPLAEPPMFIVTNMNIVMVHEDKELPGETILFKV